MRDKQPEGEIARALAEWVTLEEQFKANAKSQKGIGLRVYDWHPVTVPETPCVWNLIDDGQYENVDTARGDDDLVLAATIAVKPSDISESTKQLVTLMDVFRATVDPALASSQPLNGTVREAKRTFTRPAFPVFNDIPLIGLTMLVHLKLVAVVHPQ